MLVGVVGKANVGKSTFFKAVTLAEVAISNHPFVTVKPNSGVGYVKVACADRDFRVQCNPKHGYCLEGQRFVPVQLLDVAGLVPGAHEGKGMGNQFLDDLRQADALVHVVDMAGSTNERGEPVEPGTRDPCDDIRFLELEIDMWYFQILRRGWEKFAREVQQNKQILHKALAKQLSALRVTEHMVESTIAGLSLPSDQITCWTDDHLTLLARSFRLQTKPMVIACNKMDLPGARDNLERARKEFPGSLLIACAADCELALREAAKHGLVRYTPGDKDFQLLAADKLSATQQAALKFVRGVVETLGGTGVQQVLDVAVFQLLGLMPVFPVANSHLQDKDGNILPDCFLVPKGLSALDFAYKVHTDIGDHFIRAVDIRTRQIVGKDHKLKSGDVIEIVANR